MKKNRVIATVAGVFLFLSIVLTFVWFNSSKKTNEPAELTLAEVTTKIDQSEVKEAVLKQSTVEITDKNDRKYYANIGSDPTREALLRNIGKHNEINSKAPIKLTEEPVSSGFPGIVLINLVPMVLFFTMWGLTLAVIVYAVRTLSRNKS